MPANLEAGAAKAIKCHDKRLLSPGVAVDVEKVTDVGYRLASPHSDTLAWQAMIGDALGTRSEATADTFLYHLAELCPQNWHPSEDGGGEWCPDERQLNMILNFVAGIKPKNEMQAALAAEMVAVHLMQIKLSAKALAGQMTIQDAAIASKLARTFAMQIDTLARLQGNRSSTKQTITVRQEKHVHHHQHVHVTGGGSEIGSQPHAKDGDAPVTALLGKDTAGPPLPIAGSAQQEGLPNARRQKPRRAARSR